MSAIKLSSAKELEKFLKVLAEESVLMAKETGNTGVARQKDFATRIKRDKAALTEEDPEEEKEPTEPAPAPKPAAAPPPAEEPAEPKAPPAPTPGSEISADMNPSISSLVDAIKEIRGGRGAGDSAVETELTAYFDRLEEAERVSLIIMLRSIGGIMRQQLAGAKAPEPEQYDIFTSRKPGETAAASSAEKTQAAAPAQKSPSGEDNSPPIKVGEPVSESYRARIRDLLKRS